MNRLLILLVLLVPLALAGGGCSTVVPVTPVVPVDPTPVPVDPFNPGPPKPLPVDPTPVDPSAPVSVLTWEQVQKVKVGMTRADVDAALGNAAPKYNTLQDDRVTTLTEWLSVDAEGKPEYLSVRFRGGSVIGRARLPRAVTPPPVPVSSLPDTEIENVDAWCCGDANACALPSRTAPPNRRSSRAKVYKSARGNAGRGAELSDGVRKTPKRKLRRVSLPVLVRR